MQRRCRRPESGEVERPPLPCHPGPTCPPCCMQVVPPSTQCTPAAPCCRFAKSMVRVPVFHAAGAAALPPWRCRCCGPCRPAVSPAAAAPASALTALLRLPRAAPAAMATTAAICQSQLVPLPAGSRRAGVPAAAVALGAWSFQCLLDNSDDLRRRAMQVRRSSPQTPVLHLNVCANARPMWPVDLQQARFHSAG